MAPSVKLTRTEYDAARRHAALADATEPRATKAFISADGKRLTVELRRGVQVSIPLKIVPGLAAHAAPRMARAAGNIVVEGNGESLHWPDLDVDLSVPILVADALNVTTVSSNARRAGSATSAAKTAAVRENGKKGGRPRKDAPARKGQRAS